MEWSIGERVVWMDLEVPAEGVGIYYFLSRMGGVHEVY